MKNKYGLLAEFYWRGKTEGEKKVSQRDFVRHKYHVDWSVIELVPPGEISTVLWDMVRPKSSL
jgi:hypothetical protein